MWTLGKRSGENALNVVAKEYEGQVLIHIRHYYKATGEDRWYPTKKGITLNLEEWDKFTEVFSEIDSEVRRLRSQNEEVEPVFTIGSKRNLQSAFGGNYEWLFVLWFCMWKG